MSDIIRVGKINFANVWPVFYDFPSKSFSNLVQLFEMTPAQLNDAMRLEQIDMGFISSYAYLQNQEQYVLMRDLSISARGQVSSILLFHEKPLEDIRHGKIALADTSATSVNLLKVLLELYGGGQPTYVTTVPDLNVMFAREQADAGLLIGDDAIKWSFVKPTRFVTDIGKWWLDLTGQSMTYAVWAIRKSFAERNQRLLDELERHLKSSLTKGLRHVDRLIAKAVTQIGGHESFWRQYYTQLNYSFGTTEQAGLSAYHEALRKLGTPVR